MPEYVWGFPVGVTLLALGVALVVKFFARGLPYWKAFLISLTGLVVAALVEVAYRIGRYDVPMLPRAADYIASLVAYSIAGTIITKLAEKFGGIKKTEWLGVGAKTALTMIVLAWAWLGWGYLRSLVRFSTFATISAESGHQATDWIGWIGRE